MRFWLIPLLCPLLGACALPAADPSPGALPLTWTGDFGGGPSPAGRIVLLLDETGESWRGTMFFETPHPQEESTLRVTYRIEGAEEDGVVHVHQREVLDHDRLPDDLDWCVGRYDFSIDQRGDQSKLVGSYSSEQGCGGETKLHPTDTL